MSNEDDSYYGKMYKQRLEQKNIGKEIKELESRLALAESNILILLKWSHKVCGRIGSINYD